MPISGEPSVVLTPFLFDTGGSSAVSDNYSSIVLLATVPH